jgi:cell volume regulation protein A
MTEPIAIGSMNVIILIVSGLIAVSVFTSLISFRIGVPLLLIFLGVGLGAGEDGIGGIRFDDAPTAYFIGSVALAIILFVSGFDTSLNSCRLVAWPALTLATVGVFITSAIVGVAAHALLGFSWIKGLLMGAIVSSTDAAAVFFLLRVGGIHLRDRVRSTLEIESGSNDPMAILLTIILIEVIVGKVGGAGGSSLTWGILQAFARELGFGALLGVAGGFLIVQVVNRVELDAGLYPVVVLSLALSLFAATGLIGGSGFLAVYAAGLVAGNVELRSGQALRRFQSGMTWLSQIGMFLTLGLLATPSHFGPVLEPALLLAAVLIFVARPVAILLCLFPFNYTLAERLFISWIGLRGAVSILLAILPMLGDLPEGRTFFNVSFIIVLVSMLVQGWTIGPLARHLGLVIPPRIGPVDRVELELPGKARHELVVYRIQPDSLVANGERIPRWARPSLIVRNGRSMRIHNTGHLLPGDLVYLFIPPQQVRLLDKMFASPLSERDDRSFYGDFVLVPTARLGEVADSYGFKVSEDDRSLSVSDFLYREFDGKVEVGDRAPVGPVELIVRNLNESAEIVEIGLALEPTHPRRTLPVPDLNGVMPL